MDAPAEISFYRELLYVMKCMQNIPTYFLVQVPELVFQPSLEPDSPEYFLTLVESLIDDVFHFTTLVPRVAAHNGMEHYIADLEEVS